MNEAGLAAAYAEEQGMRQGLGQGPRDGMGPGPQQSMPDVSVEELVMMLKQGVTPDELAQNGIPVQLIEEALMMLQAEVEQGGPMQGAPDQQGLAGMYAAEGAL
jgi:hypothetical protein